MILSLILNLLPFQQWHQIVQERVIRMRCVCDGLVTPELAMLGPHIVLQHPKVAALQRLLVVIVFEAIEQCAYALVQLLLISSDYISIGLCVVQLGASAVAATATASTANVAHNLSRRNLGSQVIADYLHGWRRSCCCRSWF